MPRHRRAITDLLDSFGKFAIVGELGLEHRVGVGKGLDVLTVELERLAHANEEIADAERRAPLRDASLQSLDKRHRELGDAFQRCDAAGV